MIIMTDKKNNNLTWTNVVVVYEVTSTKKHKHIKEYEELVEIVNRIIKDSEEGSLIIVEGKKDLKALRSLGVKGAITTYRSREDLMEKIQTFKPVHIILLLDLDYEGGEKTISLKKFLEGSGEKIDLTYWNMLRKFKRFGLTNIESLPKILSKMVE